MEYDCFRQTKHVISSFIWLGAFSVFCTMGKGSEGYEEIFSIFVSLFPFFRTIYVDEFIVRWRSYFFGCRARGLYIYRLPFGKGDYLIDTGGSLTFEKQPWQERDQAFDVGEDTVVPFLKSKGVTKLISLF